MARDGALPFSGVLRHIYRDTETPVVAISFVAMIAIVISLFALGNALAFTAVGGPYVLSLQVRDVCRLCKNVHVYRSNVYIQ